MPPATETTTQAFLDAWDEFFRATRRARGRAAASGGDSAGGLSSAQYHLLAPLGGGGELPVGQLAIEAGVAAPTASKMVEGLVQAGLVERRESASDRRVKNVALTAAGDAAVAAKGGRITALRLRVAGELSEDERATAAALLHRLAAVVDEQL